MPQYEVYFSTEVIISQTMRESLTIHGSLTGGVPVQCEPENQTSFDFFKLPPSEYTVCSFCDDTLRRSAPTPKNLPRILRDAKERSSSTKGLSRVFKENSPRRKRLTSHCHSLTSRCQRSFSVRRAKNR